VSKNHDITGKLISEGDWLIIPGTSSQMAPLRFAKVLGFGSTGKPRIGSFEIMWNTDYEWGRYPIKPITLTIAEKSFVVAWETLPDGLKKYIAEVLHGDTEHLVKQIKANKAVTAA
jgi:hypothetical protein